MDLRESRDLTVGPLLADELFERRSVPQPERMLQGGHSIVVVGIGGVGDGTAEERCIDIPDERVASARRFEHSSADRRTDARHRCTQRTGGDLQDVREPFRTQAAR